MNVTVTPRDYSLIGRDSKLAEELGLVSAEWYKAPIARKRLKELMQRSDTRCDQRHAHLDRRLPRDRRNCGLFLAWLVVAAVLPRLWRALRLVDRFALA